MPETLRIGLDIGSTTIKCVVLDEADKIIYSCYERHLSLIAQKTRELLTRLDNEVVHGAPVRLSISGSAGMGLALGSHISFVQEVYAEKTAVNHYCPGTDVVIELGGEDAKILFLTGGFEMRMNGTCAGGTGAFIDQMAALMKITPDELNNLAAHHEKIYTIASRCGVFAKSDVQPLLNQGARKEDIAAGILYAVVNQTVAGLSQGRRIEGKVLSLGGPLSFLPELRKGFDDVLKTQGACPENALCFVALGAALSGMGKEMTLAELADIFGSRLATKGFRRSSAPARITKPSSTGTNVPRAALRFWKSRKTKCSSASTPALQPSNWCSAIATATSASRSIPPTTATPSLWSGIIWSGFTPPIPI